MTLLRSSQTSVAPRCGGKRLNLIVYGWRLHHVCTCASHHLSCGWRVGLIGFGLGGSGRGLIGRGCLPKASGGARFLAGYTVLVVGSG